MSLKKAQATGISLSKGNVNVPQKWLLACPSKRTTGMSLIGVSLNGRMSQMSYFLIAIVTHSLLALVQGILEYPSKRATGLSFKKGKLNFLQKELLEYPSKRAT